MESRDAAGVRVGWGVEERLSSFSQWGAHIKHVSRTHAQHKKGAERRSEASSPLPRQRYRGGKRERRKDGEQKADQSEDKGAAPLLFRQTEKRGRAPPRPPLLAGCVLGFCVV